MSAEFANTWSGGIEEAYLTLRVGSVGADLRQNFTLSEVFGHFLGEPLDGPDPHLGAVVPVKGRRRSSLQERHSESDVWSG